MPIHRIRLRGPWEVRLHENATTGRMTVPGTLRDGGWAGFTGRVSFYRRFGRPSNLTAGEAVWLTFERVVGSAKVILNDERLGVLDGAGSFEVTSRLLVRNGLEVVVEAAHDGCGIVGHVSLDMRVVSST